MLAVFRSGGAMVLGERFFDPFHDRILRGLGILPGTEICTIWHHVPVVPEPLNL